jgi:predicted site-specific integrase-resolvase
MTKHLLKRADILEWLQITPATYRKWLESGLLKPVKLRGIAKKWFRRTDIIKTLQLEENP